METLTGQWNGFYNYNTEDGSEYKTRFSMTLTYTGGDIIGKCVDVEEDGGNPEPASITGFFKGNLISFIKEYPHYWFFNENGQIEKIMDKKHPEIHYSARYNSNKFIGTWEMELDTWSLGEGYISKSISGTWEMEKE